MQNPLILASASPIRASLLERCGVNFEIMPARTDEAALMEALCQDGLPPRDIADALAEMKGFKIAQRQPQRRVLAADQTLDLEGRLFSKAQTVETARENFKQLRGKTHQLFSAAVLFENAQPVWRHIGRARLTMRDLSDTELDAYITRHGDGVCATVGGYKIEEDGPSLFSRIEGDYFSILGLPLLEVLHVLRGRGVV